MADAYDELAERLVGGAQEEYVRRLTEQLASMLAAGVDNPGMYALSVAYAREEAMGVWASMQAEVTSDARSAFEEALALEDEEIAAALLEAHGVMASAGLTLRAQNAVAEAARGMAEVVRRQNVALAETAAGEWYRVVADAVTRVQMGDSRRAVMEDAWAALASAGIRTVDYKSGVRTTVDAAIRRHVVTQQNQCRNDLLFARMDEWGHDLVFVSAHWGARPSHSVWQGKVYSRSGSDPRYPALAPATGYGTVGGLCGANCRHTMTPYVEGLSRLPSTDFSAQERLTGMTSDEYYEATQRQRALERRVRERKRAVALGQENGCDMASERYALGRTQAKLRELCSEKHLRRDYERERAYGVAQQPRALRVSFRENRAREDARRYRVNGRTVESKGWASMVSRRLGPCGAVAVEDARRMLRHRGGTAGEDLYAYDLTDGKRLDSVVTSRARQGVEPSKRMRSRVAKAVAAGHEVATIHNHPGSSIPSAADVLALKATGCAFGVIACHDGSLYVYRIVGDPAPGYTLENIGDVVGRRLDDEGRALEAIEELLGVHVEHIRSR